jgi:threonine/homoserine/homoserine lactone efflux protein
VGVDVALIISMAAFSFATAVSPGPNNTVLMTLGGAGGFRGARPHLIGMVIGLSAMVAALGTGLGALFEAYPVVYEVLKWVGFAYILYMAWLIFRSSAPGTDPMKGVPIGVIRSTLFQLVNPKAWIVIATFVTAYVPTELGLWALVLSGVVFILGTMPGALVWAVAGTVVGRFLRSPRSRRIFTSVMALALVGSMIPVLFL